MRRGCAAGAGTGVAVRERAGRGRGLNLRGDEAAAEGVALKGGEQGWLSCWSSCCCGAERHGGIGPLRNFMSVRRPPAGRSSWSRVEGRVGGGSWRGGVCQGWHHLPGGGRSVGRGVWVCGCVVLVGVWVCAGVCVLSRVCVCVAVRVVVLVCVWSCGRVRGGSSWVAVQPRGFCPTFG